MNSKGVGELGEDKACDFLKDRGYKILERNFKKKMKSGPSFGEIDIVARKKGAIVFVEVKTLRQAHDERSGKNTKISPEQRVNLQKQRQLKKLAQIWLSENKISLDTKWQIDVISVIIDLVTEDAKISHFENAVGC